MDAKRSRRVYVYWGIALTLLVTAGLVCWLVVVPVWRVHKAVGGTTSSLLVDKSRDGAYGIGGCTGYSAGPRPPADPIEFLDGPQAALSKLRLYVGVPAVFGLKRKEAVLLLERCGLPATDTLLGLLKDEDPRIRCHAAWALGNIGPKPSEAQPALECLFDDPDENTRVVALQAAAKLHRPDIGHLAEHPDRWKQILREARESEQ